MGLVFGLLLFETPLHFYLRTGHFQTLNYFVLWDWTKEICNVDYEFIFYLNYYKVSVLSRVNHPKGS